MFKISSLYELFFRNKKEVMIEDMNLSRSDRELLVNIIETIISFIESEKTSLQMDPMNSYRRRMIHKICSEYNLNSKSTGEGENRSVCIEKTSNTTIPKNYNDNLVIDRGIEIFYAKPGSKIVLRNDGSFGVSLDQHEGNILDTRSVIDGEFRIRNNKIICKQDKNW